MNDIEQLKEKIIKLKRERNCIILAHYYTRDEVQDVADYIGDSLALSRQAQNTKADIILFAGVLFMAETAKILSPQKKVLLPDIEAGCSLAASCKADDFKKFIDAHPNHTVVSYVNTNSDVKALTDIVCTSSNAVKIVNSLDKDEKIIFGPDRNLGNYIKSVTGRENMVIWDGACHVHEQFSLEKLLELKKQHPLAKVLTHPECKKPLLMVSDHIGSTAALLEYSKQSESSEFIVVTEPGILYQMRRACPNKTFYAAPPTDSNCACNDCSYMKLVTLEKIYASLLNDTYQIEIDEKIRKAAEKSILRMLEIG
ncbi:MAG: quinolinate synthase NadA [Rikenellaceae bacterium]